MRRELGTPPRLQLVSMRCVCRNSPPEHGAACCRQSPPSRTRAAAPPTPAEAGRGSLPRMEDLTPEARAAVAAGKTLYADSIESLVRCLGCLPWLQPALLPARSALVGARLVPRLPWVQPAVCHACLGCSPPYCLPRLPRHHATPTGALKLPVSLLPLRPSCRFAMRSSAPRLKWPMK